MKNVKRLTAMILAMLIIIVSLPTVSVFAATDDDMYYGKKMLSQMPNSSNLLTVYELLVEGCAILQSEIFFPYGMSITREECNIVYDLFYADYPQYFWLVKGTPGGQNASTGAISIMPLYSIGYIGYGYFDDFEDAKVQYNKKVEELTSDLADKTDYEKALILHDRLCQTTTYTLDCNNHQNSYGALVEGKAVCNGYARAYQHLLKTVGIPAWYVNGSSRSARHAWNTVKIDGEWYYTDPTWDDTDNGFDFFDNAYEYFNITTAKLLVDHEFDTKIAHLVPYITATKANYYVKEDLIFTAFDVNRVIAALARNKDNMIQASLPGTDDYVRQFATGLYTNADKIAQAFKAETYTYKKAAFKFKDSANYIFVIDFDIKTNCKHEFDNSCDTTCNLCVYIRSITHTYDNACDTTCNVCSTVRSITHTYNNDCDSDCNICGTIRSVPSHIYNHIYDPDCNICGATRNAKPLEWSISVKTTGVYFLKPNDNYTCTFDSKKIIVLDKDGHAVKYNKAEDGFPLVKGENYTVKFNYNCMDDISGTLTWNKTRLSETIFPDTYAGDWYNDAVTYAVGAGIITGYQNGKFGTSDSIQRQDFLVMLARYDGVDLDEYSYKSKFADVARNSYYEAAVNWGVKKGITTGYTDGSGKFGVGDKMTREQLVTFLCRYAEKCKGKSITISSDKKAEISSKYNDFKKVSDFSRDAIYWAIANGVINGKTDTTVVPQGNAQRCEVAKIMYNIYLNSTLK